MSYKSEDVAEAQRLTDELMDVFESLSDSERTFVSQRADQFARFGEGAHVSHDSVLKLRQLYEHYIG